MERDYQFEVQYLLTVTIAATGALASQYLRSIFDARLGFILLLAIFAHIVIINHLYVVQRVTDVRIPVEESLDVYSQYTLFAVTLMIPLLTLHALFTPIAEYISNIYGHSPMFLTVIVEDISLSPVIILISYVVPLLLTVGLTHRFTKSIFGGLRVFSDINFVVAPTKFKIYSQFEHTEPLFIKIENNGDDAVEFDLDIRFPGGVVWKDNNGEKRSNYQKKVNLPPDYSDRINLELRYDGRERKTSLIEIGLKHDSIEKEKELQVLLEAE